METGNMHKKIGKDHACGSGDILADRQRDRHTDILITILCNCSHGRSNKDNLYTEDNNDTNKLNAFTGKSTITAS